MILFNSKNNYPKESKMKLNNVEGDIWNRMWFSVNYSVEVSVRISVNDSIWNSMHESIWNSVEYDVVHTVQLLDRSPK
jgi:hypothetical protein